MSSHVDVSISFLRRTISYTEMTNTSKNQIIMSTLSVSKLVEKKLYHSVTFVFCAFYLRKNSLEKNFLAFKSPAEALQNWL
jgi:hypothetical protein